jgi:molecular chaperone DnaK (HSP70)
MSDKSRLVYGIDLGTTYSCISQVDKFDQAVVLRNFEGDATTPSVVYIDGNNVVVGKEAKSLSADEPEKTVAFIKRHIGVDSSFDNAATLFPEGKDPVFISALILKKLVKDANEANDNPEPIKDVVITCPAYFGTKERVQTKQAGQEAGLNVLAVINEPTAAAISYGMRVNERKIIMVYDLGGGTFDVTIIRVDGGTIKVIATGGDHKLGGVDWDMALAEYMLNAYNTEHDTKYTLDSDARLKNLLLLEAEQKKKILTAKPQVRANVTYNGVSTKVEITRELFDQLTEGKLNETIDKTLELLEIAKGKDFEKVDEVLLVGGSSRMPQIKKRIDNELGVNARLDDPDECVAKGAAIFAINEAFAAAIDEYEHDDTGEAEKPKPIANSTRTRIVNVTSKTYGTDVSDGEGGIVVKNLIFANTALPTKARESFLTCVDGQSVIPMKVYESDVTDPKNDGIIDERFATQLDDKVLSLSKYYPQGTSITVVFEIDNEGILSVHAEVDEIDTIDFTLEIKGVKNEKQLELEQAQIAKMNLG